MTLAAEAGHLLGVPWSPLSPLVLGAPLGAALPPLRRRLPAPAADGADGVAAGKGSDGAASPADGSPVTGIGALAATRRGRAGALLTGLVIGGGAIAIQALGVMGSVRAVSQTYDNVFHLNAVRHILRLGDASAGTVGGMTALPGAERFYPALWHQAVSLVVRLSSQEIPLASNMVMLLLAVVVWPLGLMALVRTCTRSGPVGWMAAGALAGISGAFPLSLMAFGILSPYFLSMILMPVLVIMLVHLAGLAPDSPQAPAPLPAGGAAARGLRRGGALPPPGGVRRDRDRAAAAGVGMPGPSPRAPRPRPGAGPAGRAAPPAHPLRRRRDRAGLAGARAPRRPPRSGRRPPRRPRPSARRSRWPRTRAPPGCRWAW
ncbi:DUF6541 family protein [Brachybacterium sp. GPGPB12]|uniref:DUF6541 family protein n=1 Tax=Brachybacterium sp. GPGPB12 TaxID=3023517 RepID=UPI0031343AE2